MNRLFLTETLDITNKASENKLFAITEIFVAIRLAEDETRKGVIWFQLPPSSKAFEHANLMITEPGVLTNEIMLNVMQNFKFAQKRILDQLGYTF